MRANDTTGTVTSADQDGWVELAQAIRAQLAQQAQMIPAMKPDEVRGFIEAARAALWLEQDAASFDREVELKRARFSLSE